MVKENTNSKKASWQWGTNERKCSYFFVLKFCKQNEYNNELALYDLLNISKNVVHDTSRDIYKYSHFIKSLQCVSNIHVIRRWSDDIFNLNDKEFVKSLAESKLIETGNTE